MKSRHSYIIILIIVLLLVFHAVHNYVWISHNPAMLSWHSLYLLKSQLEFCKETLLWIKSYNASGILFIPHFLSHVFHVNTTWPRLVFLITFLFQVFFGWQYIIVRMANLFYLAVLIFSLYGIGSRLINKSTGLLSVFLLSFYPAIFTFTRTYGLDLPLSAAVALNLYVLLRTENFRHSVYSAVFGVCLGLGILTKAQAIFYLIGPVIYVATRHFSDKNFDKHAAKNISNALVLAFAVSALWWWSNGWNLWKDFFSSATISYFSTHPMRNSFYLTQSDLVHVSFMINWLFFYLQATIFLISPLFFFVFLISLFYLIKKRGTRGSLLLIIWIAVPYIIFTLNSGKLNRHFLPALSAFALLTAAGVDCMSKRVKVAYLSLVTIIGMAQFFAITYNGKLGSHLAKLLFLGHAPIDKEELIYFHSVQENNLKTIIEKISVHIEKKFAYNSRFCLGLLEYPVMSRYEDKQAMQIEYWLKLHFLNIDSFRPFYAAKGFLSEYRNFDFLIIITKESPPLSYDGLRITRNPPDWKTVGMLEEAKFNDMKQHFGRYTIEFSDRLYYPSGYNIYLLAKNSQ